MSVACSSFFRSSTSCGRSNGFNLGDMVMMRPVLVAPRERGRLLSEDWWWWWTCKLLSGVFPSEVG